MKLFEIRANKKELHFVALQACFAAWLKRDWNSQQLATTYFVKDYLFI